MIRWDAATATALLLPLLRFIFKNPGKTEVLLVLPPTALLNSKSVFRVVYTDGQNVGNRGPKFKCHPIKIQILLCPAILSCVLFGIDLHIELEC